MGLIAVAGVIGAVMTPKGMRWNRRVRLAIEHRPDVAIVDLRLPGLDGVETIRWLTRDCPGTRVVVLTSHAGDADIFPAIFAGALRYLQGGRP